MRNNFYKQIAVKTAVDTDIVQEVIEHSLSSLIQYSRNSSSLELTGWGTFYLRENKIPIYIENFEKLIEKKKQHLLTLKSEYAISQLEGKIEWMEKELIRIKEQYGKD